MKAMQHTAAIEKIIIPLIWIVTFQYFYLIIQPTFIFIIYLYQYFAR